MARTTWTTQIKSAGNWIGDGSIYRPNDNLSIQKRSTQSVVSLANGGNAYLAPSTKYIDGALTFIWFWDDGTTKTKIEGYINSQNDVKIIDHDANEYIGRFTHIESTQMVGEDPDRYDVKAVLTIMPDLA